MRVSENMRFYNAQASLSQVQGGYNDLLIKMSSQKKINKISDDPVGMAKIINFRQLLSSIDEHRGTIEKSDAWLKMTETTLASVNDLLVRALELAVGQANEATNSAAERKIVAKDIEQIIEELRSLANAQYENRYLFAGSRTDVPPFRENLAEAEISLPEAGSKNHFSGNVTTQGTYTGTVNGTYVVKITQGGSLNEARYRLSTDGGVTWGDETSFTDLGGGVFATAPRDGFEFRLQGGNNEVKINDSFSAHAYARGYYRGNGASLAVNIGRFSDLTYNITGEEVFTSQGAYGVDVFTVLNDFKLALESNNSLGIRTAIDGIRKSQDQVILKQALAGTKMNRLEMAKSSLTYLEERTIELMSQTEDADFAQLVTQFNMKEIALKASYAVAAKLADVSILNFIK